MPHEVSFALQQLTQTCKATAHTQLFLLEMLLYNHEFSARWKSLETQLEQTINLIT
jgi:hypothetical protein